MGQYDDIINLPHHVSKKHPQMSLETRSAQFAPFASLAGYEDDIIETERFTDDREEIGEEQIEIINRKLNILKDKIKDKPKILITYFVPDKKKAGGTYKTVTANIKKIDEYKRIIILDDGIQIPITEIVDIRSEMLKI